MAKTKQISPLPGESIGRLILILRGQRVVLDTELAALYDVATKALNQAVKRNAERFPADFMFRLTRAETRTRNRSQIVTGSQKHAIHDFHRSPSPSTARSWPPRSSTAPAPSR